MKNHDFLSALERRLFTANFQDGFIDLILSSVYLQTALIVLLGRYGIESFLLSLLMSGVTLAGIGGAFLIRRNVTGPRFGYLRFRKDRRRRMGGLFILNILILGVLLVLQWVDVIPPDEGVYTVLPAAMTVLVIFSGMAAAFNLPRVYLYSLAAAGAFPFGKWLDGRTGYPFALPVTMLVVAAAMIFSSLLVLLLFLRRNPLPGREDTE